MIERGASHMRIQNLGPIKDANITLNRLTVFIGNNGMGKTLAAYAVFAFRNWLETSFQPGLFTLDDLKSLIENDEATISTSKYHQQLVNKIVIEFNALNKTGEYFQAFFKDESLYQVGTTKIEVDQQDLTRVSDINETIWSYMDRNKAAHGVGGYYQFQAELNLEKHVIALHNHEETLDGSSAVIGTTLDVVARQIDLAIANFWFNNMGKSTYLPAERIGINVFRTRINTQLINENLANPASEQAPLERYPYPIESYIRFLNGSLGSLSGKYGKSVNLVEQKILGTLVPGDFSYDKDLDRIQYQLSDNQQEKIQFNLVSSSLKSLFGLDLFLRGDGLKGYLLLDEPEMNLHPQRQKLITDLLFNMAIRATPVVISTHSDYIVKELVNQILQSKVSDPQHRGQAEHVSVYEFTSAGVKNLGDISQEEVFGNFDQTTDQINQRYYELMDRLEDAGGATDE